MKAFLFFLLSLIVLGLCGICIVQWKREFVLNERIEELTAQLIAENELRIQAEEKGLRLEQEIARITTLRAETESALLDATEQVQLLTVDQTSRGYSIGIWMNDARTAKAELAAYKQLAGKGTDALKDRNSEVSAQNTAIEKANDTIKQLASERDSAITKLNTQVREYNALVEKYNKLAKSQ
ncbi:hypothetical protein EI77_01329 [Prosthecobacter fusiformis]|uniref:Uncharacterized protein n=1 Tax=Prosthecobacter fusiformis TaxID=48464 RepID=A0A4V3FG12_9BACT|nr:hypothetical protein [Prosthecobacter fusiformis]TDU72863.1 hypothetical protein EI77_01329 [Prosthecobacter fusiformis]